MKQTLTLTLDPETIDGLKLIAAAKGTKMSTYVNALLMGVIRYEIERILSEERNTIEVSGHAWSEADCKAANALSKMLCKMNEDEFREWDERIQGYKLRIRQLKAEIGDEEPEHPDERVEYEEFQVQVAANNRYCWVEIPAEVWTKLGLRGREWVKVKLGLIPELNEEEKRAYGNAKMEVFLKAISESVPKA